MDRGKILLMDDDFITTLSVVRGLREYKYEVETAIDGFAAISLYKKTIETKKHFEVVILDLVVPGSMGGEETIKKLLEIDSGVKAIATSDSSVDPIITNFREYGFCAAVAKPYGIDELYEAIQNVREM